MDQPKTAFEFLDRLSAGNGKQKQSFRDIGRFLGQRARERGVPVNGQFELTPLCNFNCGMCYVHLTPELMAQRTVLPTAVWKDLMHQAWEAGMLMATLTGGECLAYPGFEELFLYLHSLGCEVAVMTNGFLLDDRRIRFFREHKPCRIHITLYGWNDDVYERVTGQRAFGTVTENIRKAMDAGLPVYLSVTPSTWLGEDVMETIRVGTRLAGSVSVNDRVFAPREETGRSGQRDDPALEQYLRIYRLQNSLRGVETVEIPEEELPPCGGPSHACSECGLRCGGGRSGFVVDWQGTMFPCNKMEMIRAYPLRDGFAAAWAGLNREACSWPRIPECEGCAYESICGSCAANALQFAPPGKLPAALCEQTRYLVRHGVRHLPDCE